jgi:hypothetical protein
MFFGISFLSQKAITKISLLFASFFLIYPLFVINGVLPHENLVEMASKIDTERAQSLQYRFSQESILVEHAVKKPLLGWGTWGRNRLSDTISDGYWIILFGQSGFTGFGALAVLFWVIMWRSNRSINLLRDRDQQIMLASHAFIVSIIILDQLPNSSMHSISWFLTGALAGRCLGINSQSDEGNADHQESDVDRKLPNYERSSAFQGRSKYVISNS